MKTNWQIKKLGEVCDFQGGTQPPKSTFIYEPREGYVRLLQIRDFKSDKNATYISDSSKLKKCKATDIMIGRYGASVGQILFGKSGAYNVALMKTIPSEFLDKNYLKLFLETENIQKWFASRSRAAQAGFTQNEIGELEIPLPPLATQHKIVAILDEKFVKLREAKRLRQEAIGDTEKILGATLREIFEEGKEKGWEEKEMGEYVKLQGGFAFKSSEYKTEGIPLIRIQNLQEEVLDLMKPVFIEEKEVYEKFKLLPGDILVAMSGATTGKLARVREDNLPAYLNQRVGRFMITDKTNLDSNFLWYFMGYIKEYILKEAYGGAQPNISPSKIESIKIPLPPLVEQQKIVTHLDVLSEKLRTLRELQQSQLDDMKRLEKAYLREAFRGDLV